MKRHYGWKRQLADQRDIPYKSIRQAFRDKDLPESVDLRPQCPPIYDQGDLGSCTANAIVGAYEFDLNKQDTVKIDYRGAHGLPLDGKLYTPLSRLFLYYNERDAEGTVNIDAGAFIRDGMKSIAKQGVCEEALWPYDIQLFSHEPSEEAYVNAEKHQAIFYSAVNQSIQDIQIALADEFPVIFGFTVYESFESKEVAKTGIMPMPKRGERIVGGHAVLAVGYNQNCQIFLCRNSWSQGWGVEGYFWMPFSYLHLCSDFWVLKSVE